MSTRGTNPLLMGCSLEELRRKLGDPASPLAPWWRHFTTLARRDPVWFSPYTVLTALVTGEESDRELARQSFLRFVTFRAEGEISNEAQYHTHVVSAPLARWAVFYDWIADLGILPPAEDAAFRDFLLDYAHVFSLPHIQSRRLDFDNQILANAFGAATVGYVLGIRRGDNALARRLFASGVNWVRELLGRLPAGGYSPEGSTYHEQVVLPLTLLSALLLEEAIGEPVIERGLPPRGNSTRQLLETSFRMVGPNGLLPAWDDYGYQHATIKSGLTYLARLARDPQPLAVIRDCNLWYRTAHPAWEIDDRLWTLVWWPAELDRAEPARFDSWMQPEIGGALQQPDRRLRLFQYWDECGGAPSSGRENVDPNAILLEAFSSPLLLDGSGSPGPALVPLPEQPILDYIGTRTVETVKEYIHSAWGGTMSTSDAIRTAMAGSVGQANSLVLDGETWYVPLAPCTGTGQAFHRAGDIQALRGDAIAYYTDRYDLSRATRASVLLRGRYVVVSDRIVARTPHTVTWQAFLREDVKADAARAVIRTPEQVRCDLIPLQAGSLELTPAPGYPKGPLEGRSVRLQHTVPAASDVRLDVALVPQRLLDTEADLTDGWAREIAGRRDAVSLATAYLSDAGADADQPRVFRRSVRIVSDGRRRFLAVHFASRMLEVAVNGRRVTATTTQAQGVWSQSVTHLPWFFDITDALRDGMNEITLTAPYFHGETVGGPVHLCAAREAEPVRIARTGPDTFAATVGSETDLLVIEREGGPAPWAGGSTDARYAVLAWDGSVSACHVTALSLPSGLRLRSSAPCDLQWTPARTALARTVDGASLEIAWDGGRLAAEVSGCVEITYQGALGHRLVIHLPSRRTVVVNGIDRGQHGGPACPDVELDLTPSAAVGGAPTTAGEVYSLAERAGAAAGDALSSALRGPDWRVQMAAADAIGRLGVTKAVPVLLERFAGAEAEIPYPVLTRWWRASKMLRGDNRPEGPDPSLPMPISVKRWRVKQAVVTALGRLGDRRAVEPLEKALQRCDDFFPVTAQLAVALGRLGSPTSIPVLRPHLNHMEVNLRVHARLALALIEGEIDRAAFEAQAGLG